MKVQVTQKNIDDGLCGNSFFCPIALAIRSQDKNRYGVYIGNSDGYYYTAGEPRKAKEFKLPIDAQLFIMNFDRKLQPVEPFEFELEMLD